MQCQMIGHQWEQGGDNDTVMRPRDEEGGGEEEEEASGVSLWEGEEQTTRRLIVVSFIDTKRERKVEVWP
jgi:hypothetical protein